MNWKKKDMQYDLEKQQQNRQNMCNQRHPLPYSDECTGGDHVVQQCARAPPCGEACFAHSSATIITNCSAAFSVFYI